jgi:hypothetical protein
MKEGEREEHPHTLTLTLNHAIILLNFKTIF